MNYLVLSDLHGSLLYFNRILEASKSYNIDQIICLGDYLYHGPRNALPEGYSPMELAECINNLTTEFIGIRGNCDAEVDQVTLKPSISDTYKIIPVNDRMMCITHGHHYDASHMPEGEFSIFASGHTHLPVLERQGSKIILNPGSVTIPRGGHPHTFCVITPTHITIYDEYKNIYKQLVL